jgi:hypothetical protein
VIWATWQGIKIDRLACIWLVRRFVDPEARFRYIAPHVSPPVDAIPFDIPGVRFSHHGGSASFRAIYAGHGLQDAVLERIAAIVDAADAAGDEALNPEAIGLDAVCSSLRDVVGSDEEAARIAEAMFDALYVTLGGPHRSALAPEVG